MSFRSYVYILITVIVFSLMLMAGINIAMDPFNGFGSPRIKHLNDKKVETVKHPFVTQTLAIRNQRPDTLILGSSRTSVGIDPNHPSLRSDNTYNLSLFGLNLSQVAKLYDFTNAIHPPRRVVIGLDFFAFNKYAPGRTDFDESLLLADKGWKGSIADSFVKTKLILNWQTLKSSFNTLFAQHQSQPVKWSVDNNGQTDPSQMEALMLERKTQRFAFIASETSYIRNMYFPWPYKKYDLGLAEGDAPIAAFRQIVRQAYAKDIELHLFISPVHARQLEVIKNVGLWENFETWKLALVKLVSEEAREAGKTPYPLWDFSGYNSITMEKVSPKDDRKARMRWYWESSHYRSETGDLVLNRMLGSDKPLTNSYQDFGTRLTQDNIQSHLEKIRMTHAGYAHRNSEDVAEVAELVKLHRSN